MEHVCSRNPFVSKRIGIGWNHGPLSEDSAVLVLSSRVYTQPQQEHPFLVYLDLRLPLHVSQSTSSHISWASGGIRLSLPQTPNLRYRWLHDIDSRNGSDGYRPIDEGEVISKYDPITGKNTDVESGVGWNPASGRDEPYEEIWR